MPKVVALRDHARLHPCQARHHQEADVIDIAALTSAAALAWLYLLTLNGGYWRTSHRQPAVGQDSVPLPAVTVVIPARNEADMLPACLASLLGQDYAGRLTVVLVDDDSSDSTAKTAAEIGTTADWTDRKSVV